MQIPGDVACSKDDGVHIKQCAVGVENKSVGFQFASLNSRALTLWRKSSLPRRFEFADTCCPAVQNSLVPLQHEPSRDHHIVLPARNCRDVVGRRAAVKVASFASKGDESPEANIDAGAKIEHPASKLSRNGVRPAVDSRGALFIIRIAATDKGVRRNPRRGAEF